MNAAGNGFKLRSGVDDFAVWQNVVAGNEYKLPSRFHEESIVVDIGAHIGCFALAAHQRGARKIFCYEVDPENYIRLASNVKTLDSGFIFPYNVAVWRSDLGPSWRSLLLNFTDSEMLNVGGGGNVLLQSDTKRRAKMVNVLPFDEVIDRATYGGKRVFLAKFDCEGSEWPILLTSTRLHMIDWIVGEFHEIGGPNMKYVRDDQVHPKEIPQCAKVDGWNEYTAEGLKSFLEDAGFLVTIAASENLPWLGKFWAVRR